MTDIEFDEALGELIIQVFKNSKRVKKMKNDRLRFRAWDPQKQCYYDDFLVRSDGDGAMYTPLEEGEDEGRLIIEQCTGLRDGTGRLIYEGDIIKTSDGNGVVYYSQDACFAISNDNYTVAKDGVRPFDVSFFFYLLNEEIFEIVGNIHENSEFMEQIK